MSTQAHTIYAHTAPSGPSPAYVNISTPGGNDVVVYVRSQGGANTSFMHMTHDQLQALAIDLNAYLAGPGREHLTANAGGFPYE